MERLILFFLGAIGESRSFPDKILEYNHYSEEWTNIGTLKKEMIGRDLWPLVSIVEYKDFEEWCPVEEHQGPSN